MLYMGGGLPRGISVAGGKMQSDGGELYQYYLRQQLMKVDGSNLVVMLTAKSVCFPGDRVARELADRAALAGCGVGCVRG